MKTRKGLSLPDRLLIVVIALMVIPFISLCGLLFMNYYYWDTTRYRGKESIQAPKWLQKELAAIIEKDEKWFEKVPEQERDIMLLTDAEGNIMYKGFTVYTDVDVTAFSGSFQDMGQAVMALMDNQPIGLSLYRYNNQQGLMAYFVKQDSLPQILSQWLWVLAVLYFIACLFFPLYISSRLIMQLRRSVSRLEEGARQVEQGNFYFRMEKLNHRDELKPLSDAFQAMQKQLREEENQKKRFLMAISHDLKTPLTSIKGYLEAIEDGMADNPEKLEEYLRILQRKSNILEIRINSLIDFSCLDTESLKLKTCTPMKLNTFLNSLSQDYRKDMQISGHIFHCNYSLPNSAEIIADPDLLYRAFENILNNAQTYCARGAKIELQSYIEGSNVVFLITDRGGGINEKEQGLIFEPFFRGDSSRNQGGMGLGLASTDFIIRNYGGSIKYRNHSDGGAEFHITLPLHQLEKPSRRNRK